MSAMITVNSKNTKLNSVKNFDLTEELVGENNLADYMEKRKALKAAEARLFEAAAKHPSVSSIGGKPIEMVDQPNGNLQIGVRFEVIVEGQYKKIDDDPFKVNHVDSKTINQLINSKLLTDEQKQNLLVIHLAHFIL